MNSSIRRVAPLAALTAALAIVPGVSAKSERSGKGGRNADVNEQRGESRSGRCKARTAGWVVRGTLVEHALVGGDDGTYSGTVSIVVTKTNKHARAENGEDPKTYSVENVKGSFDDLPDRTADGEFDLADVEAGDEVKVIGRIAKAKRRCPEPEEAPAPAIRKVAFDVPEIAEEPTR